MTENIIDNVNEQAMTVVPPPQIPEGWTDSGSQPVVAPMFDAGRSLAVDGNQCLMPEYLQPLQAASPGFEESLVQVCGAPFTAQGQPNQNYFAFRFKHETDIIFEPHRREYFFYDRRTGLWKPITEARLKNMLRAFVKQFADSNGNPMLAPQLSNGVMSGIMSILRGYAEKSNPFARQTRVVHLKNGMLDLAADPPVLKPFAASYMSRNQLEVEYDPLATCPRFLNDLMGPVLSPADVELLQKWAGMTLLGTNLTQQFMIQRGPGGTGKGTFANIIERMLGTDSVAMMRTYLLESRFELYRFVDKLLLTGKDVKGSFLNESGAHTIKALVGGDGLDAEKKGGGSVHLKGTFNMLISTNCHQKLKLDGDESAWRRRLLIVEYRARQAAIKVVPNFDATLLAEEGPGILNWIIQGVAKLWRDINETGKIRLEAEQERRIQDVLEESDSVKVFIKNMTVQSEADDVSVDELVRGYAKYCQSRAWIPLPVRKVENELKNLMSEIYHVSKRHDILREGKARNGFAGIRLLAPLPS